MIQKIIRLCLFSALLIISTSPTNAQSFELQQLTLDIQKLNQLKAILQEMKNGYDILTKGYNTIKDLSEGNFNLHQTFLNGLLTVSPTVRKYARIAEIVTMEKQLISQYKNALSNFTAGGVFSSNEIDYMSRIYNDLVDRSSKNMDALLMVITDNQLRMNDAERLGAIDKIYQDMNDELGFINAFNQKTGLLGTQRQYKLQDNNTLQQLYFK